MIALMIQEVELTPMTKETYWNETSTPACMQHGDPSEEGVRVVHPTTQCARWLSLEESKGLYHPIEGSQPVQIELDQSLLTITKKPRKE